MGLSGTETLVVRSLPFAHRVKYLLLLLRPHHWVKNLFVFAPLFFSGHFRNLHDIVLSLGCFVGFCLVASSIYALNDVIDRERDAASPSNKMRPVAAGLVSVTSAVTLGILMQLSGLLIAVAISGTLVFWLLAYTINNILYSLWLKTKVIIDIISIAAGFVIRVTAGAAVIEVDVSPWLLICTFSVSLLLGFGKRRAELMLNPSIRAVNEIYTEGKLDHMISVSTAITLIAYMLYCVAPETIARFGGNRLVYTIPFVVYGVFRYVAKLQEGKVKDPVQLVYEDRVLLIDVLLWTLSMGLLLLLAYWHL